MEKFIDITNSGQFKDKRVYIVYGITESNGPQNYCVTPLAAYSSVNNAQEAIDKCEKKEKINSPLVLEYTRDVDIETLINKLLFWFSKIPIKIAEGCERGYAESIIKCDQQMIIDFRLKKVLDN